MMEAEPPGHAFPGGTWERETRIFITTLPPDPASVPPRFGGDGHHVAPGLGRTGILPVPFNRRAGSPSYGDYRLEACPTNYYYRTAWRTISYQLEEPVLGLTDRRFAV